MNVKNIKRDKELLKGRDHIELREQINRNFGITLLSGNLTANTRSEISGVSARVYRGGVYGFSSKPETDSSAKENVIRAATDNAVFMDTHVNKGKGLLSSVNGGEIIKNLPIEETAQRRYIEFVKQLDGYISQKYKNLTGRTLAVREESIEKQLCVSDGYDGHTLMKRSYIYVFFTAEGKSGAPIELFRPIGGFGTFDENFTSPELLYEEIDELYNNIMAKREGVYAQSGKKSVILAEELSGMLAHEAVGHTVEADLVLGGSVAAHNLNKTVASPIVNMVDFAHTYKGEQTPLPVWLDDEGIPAEDTVLIKDGVLVGYMNNRESAEHFGMTPTGHARAYSFSDEPLIRMRNTAVLPGKDKIEDMIASIDDGYYLCGTNNGQADTTGEFMFGISMGYEIKKGKLGRAILDTTISGVAFDMLKTVDMISDEMFWASSGYCGKKQMMPVGMGGPAMKCTVMVGGR